MTPPSTYKLVFAGPVGSGKTTATRTLSDIEVVTTEVAASDAVRQLKPTTTVAMDYGLMKLGNGDQVRLYGTPGQKRFSFMWEILTENALGLVLLINAEAADPQADLDAYVGEFRAFIDRAALVVGITHDERAPPDLRRRINRRLAEHGLPATAMRADARRRADMSMLIRALIYSIEPFAGIDRAAPPSGTTPPPAGRVASSPGTAAAGSGRDAPGAAGDEAGPHAGRVGGDER